MGDRPGIMVFMTYQERTDCAVREGHVLVTMPFLDSPSHTGADLRQGVVRSERLVRA